MCVFFSGVLSNFEPYVKNINGIKTCLITVSDILTNKYERV